MTLRTAGMALAVSLLALAGPASAQTMLTSDQIAQSLQNVTSDAPVISAAVLQAMALQHMKQFPGESGVTQPLPVKLDSLAQINIQIQFQLNSAIIKPESYAAVGSMADAIHNPILGGYKFLVVGNTDTTGNRADNMKLSQARADAIVEALTTTFNVDPRRLEAVGLGEESLLDTANPKDPINRRVQLINVGKFLPTP
ncbi:OmpA family protein [Kaistia dalseonensis]|uniref:Outer membrane protein OmpA-like peptidoglycan-associated protein n=1 Tax=Kaistia dalseonensis TaxID=410840 RepID=A0ABU0HA87_9HYPH|nr:OmpA family protein [Kaistia dalseonensis]MCX5496610.1 OmpA family protein [Kaistia dalseonensis]MDQ0439233.1 outer membrane protein OmpA-like peptidoglycan-associated protein [Kaistia dalseonensis]